MCTVGQANVTMCYGGVRTETVGAALGLRNGFILNKNEHKILKKEK